MPNGLHVIANISEMKNNLDWSSITQDVSSRMTHAKEILAEAGVTPLTLRSLSVPSIKQGEPYGRNVLHRGDQFEVMLATWSKGAECAPHNHGFSRGVVWLVEGDFRETHYELDRNLSVLGKSILRPVGTLLNVTPGDIHSMVALDGGISLHIYTPAIQEMKVFDPNTRRTLIVSDDCGAWVPQDSQQIISFEEWP